MPNREEIPLSKQENSNNGDEKQTKESRLTGNSYVIRGCAKASQVPGRRGGVGWGSNEI